MPRGKYARPVTLHANRFGKPRYEVNDEGCWIWLGAKMPKGYGTMKWEGKSRRATRVYYEFFVGPIPDGMQLDHLCRTPACVNPSHLEAVTPRENTLRGESFAAVNARKTHCINGHPLTPENTYERGGNRRICITCARGYAKRVAAFKP